MSYKLKLNLFERFQIVQRIPQKGRYQVLICANALKSTIDVTAQDVDEFEIKEIRDENNPDQVNGIQWNPEIDTTKEFEIKTKGELKVLVDILKEMDKREEITAQTMNLANQVFTLGEQEGIFNPEELESLEVVDENDGIQEM